MNNTRTLRILHTKIDQTFRRLTEDVPEITKRREVRDVRRTVLVETASPDVNEIVRIHLVKDADVLARLLNADEALTFCAH